MEIYQWLYKLQFFFFLVLVLLISRKSIDRTKSSCIYCRKPVTRRQQAIDCDICDLWQHRACGNTGLSSYKYGLLRRKNISFQFVCDLCSSKPEADGYDVDMELSGIPNASDRFEMYTGTAWGQMESTRNSTSISINKDDISTRLDRSQQVNEFMVNNDAASTLGADISSFDVERPHRSLTPEEEEASVRNETVYGEVPVDSKDSITFEVVAAGSIRGKRKLISSAGYSFVVKRELKNGTIEWRCSVRGKNMQFPATVRQTEADFFPSHQCHNHTATPGLLTAVKIKTEAKALGKENLFETAHALVNEVIDVHAEPFHPEASRVAETNLVRMVNRTRSSTRREDPRDLMFTLDNGFLNSTISEPFFRFDMVVGRKRHLIFATNKQLDLLGMAKTWYIDGTFKVVKKPFYQLLSIHGFVRSGDDLKQIPLCFCIMSGKKKRHYKKVFQSIKDILPETKVQSFVVDFEKGLWQGIRAVFETPQINGCAFHFGQALWRKVQELGLQRVYQEHDSMYKLLRKVFALPLLPAEDIPASFAELQRRVDPEAVNVQSFLRYVEDTWIHNDIWTVDSWSVYGRSIRTNNDVEGWHNRMNRRARKGNLPFYLLITLLYKEAREIGYVVCLLQEGKIRRHQKKQTKKVPRSPYQVVGEVWRPPNQHEHLT